MNSTNSTSDITEIESRITQHGGYAGIARLCSNDQFSLSRSHTSKVLRGKTPPSYGVLCMIADCLNVRVDHLRAYIDGRKRDGHEH